jgi:predicted nucleotidyltransferase
VIDFDQLREAVLPPLLELGVQRVPVIGSVARGEETADSDVDLIVEFTRPMKIPIGLFGLAALERELGRRAGRPVEVTPADGLKPSLLPIVEADQVVLYEAA